MQTARRRRRTTVAVAASVVAHLAVLVMVLLQRPNPSLPIGEAAAAPEVVIQVLLTPRKRPEVPRPTPPPRLLRLHRPPQPRLAPQVPTAPIAPAVQPTSPPGRGPVALHPSPLPEGPRGDLRAALRQSGVGCANLLAVGLNRREREHCDEVFGKGAKTAAFAGLGLAADKQRLLEAAGARKEADYRYKHGPSPGPIPDMARPGETAEGMKASMGVAGHTATVPF